MEILSQKDYSRAEFGTHPGCSARMTWRENVSIYTEKGIPFIPMDVDNELPLDDERPEMFDKSIIPEHLRWQRGCRPEAIREDSMIIQSKVH